MEEIKDAFDTPGKQLNLTANEQRLGSTEVETFW